MKRAFALPFAAALFLASFAACAGAPGTPDTGPAGVGESTGGGEGNPRVQKINQYALQSTILIRQLLSDAKAI
jgi:hypothetical protein